ncbi:MAG: nitrilase-related carbon-nitrogen hydrolase [Microbacteriaceae bacterium]
MAANSVEQPSGQITDSRPGPVVVACCQFTPSVEDPAGNRARLSTAVSRAADAGANIVVLPELASTGYCFRSRSEVAAVAERRDGPTIAHWQQLAAEHDLVIVGGFAEAADSGTGFEDGGTIPEGTGAFYDSAALVDASGPRAVYRKVHLWGREVDFFAPASAPPPVVATTYGAIAVVICYDLEFPEWVRLPALAGAGILCAPVNWPLFPRPVGERPAEVVKVQADAAVNRMYIAACDRVGVERGTDWLGGSVIVDPDGFTVTELRLGMEGTLTATVDLAQAADKSIGDRNNVFADRRPELYR